MFGDVIQTFLDQTTVTQAVCGGLCACCFGEAAARNNTHKQMQDVQRREEEEETFEGGRAEEHLKMGDGRGMKEKKKKKKKRVMGGIWQRTSQRDGLQKNRLTSRR